MRAEHQAGHRPPRPPWCRRQGLANGQPGRMRPGYAPCRRPGGVARPAREGTGRSPGPYDQGRGGGPARTAAGAPPQPARAGCRGRGGAGAATFRKAAVCRPWVPLRRSGGPWGCCCVVCGFGGLPQPDRGRKAGGAVRRRARPHCGRSVPPSITARPCPRAGVPFGVFADKSRFPSILAAAALAI